MMKPTRPFVIAFLSSMIATVTSAYGDVKLPKIFSDGMVLQRGVKVPIWGLAAPGEEVTVTLDEQKVSAKSDEKGQWLATLEPTEAGGPFEMIAAGVNTLTVKGVLMGEVWHASGQSNMEFSVAQAANGAAEVAAADFPMIRQFLAL